MYSREINTGGNRFLFAILTAANTCVCMCVIYRSTKMVTICELVCVCVCACVCLCVFGEAQLHIIFAFVRLSLCLFVHMCANMFTRVRFGIAFAYFQTPLGIYFGTSMRQIRNKLMQSASYTIKKVGTYAWILFTHTYAHTNLQICCSNST